MKRRIYLLLSILIISTILYGCNKSTTTIDENKLQVSVSFNALYEFANAVGGDKVQISTIIPNGTEPHDFEPTSKDMKSLSTADVFIYNGLGMEAWADDVVDASNNSNLTVVEASENVEVIQNTDSEEIDEHGQYDPHTWLSLSCAKIEVQNIADAFAKADPDNSDFYQTNATAYIASLDALYTKYLDKFDNLENKSFVTSHAAFSYFCRDFGLEQNSVEDVFAEGEPTAKQLAALVKYCKENNVTTIFSEELGNTDISTTLASEVNGKIETIYTVESAEDDLSYLERMESNCEKVYASLTE